jgi:hypothetical protein
VESGADGDTLMRRSYHHTVPADRRREDRLRHDGIIGGRMTNDEEPNNTYMPCDRCGAPIVPWRDEDLGHPFLCACCRRP